jgi:hypothetical protein
MTLEYRGANATFDMPGWHCRAISSALALLDHDPTSLSVLRARRHVG